MKAHLIDTHLLVPRSRSSAKVNVKFQGHVSQKMGVSGALVFHKHILFRVKFILSSANAFDLDKYKILSFWKELSDLPDTLCQAGRISWL